MAYQLTVPDALIRYTLWSSIYDIDHPVECVETWDQLVTRFSTHVRLARKDAAGGYSPCVLQPLPRRCRKHRDGVPRQHAHRCDACVTQLTLAVFDADAGDEAAVDACDRALESAGIARHWHSSYRHGTEGRVAYRLVIPLDVPVEPDVWPNFRRAVIAKYAIPADVEVCGGRSHFYYLPSCPKGATPVTRSGQGIPLRVADFTGSALPRTGGIRLAQSALDDFELPPEPTEPVDLEPLRAELRKQVEKMRRGKNAAEQTKADLLERLLDGRPLADKSGGRNPALWAVTGMLPYRLPGQALSTYCDLLRPSMDVMLAAGTTNTWSDVERMLHGAMQDKHADDLAEEDIARHFENIKQQVIQRSTQH